MLHPLFVAALAYNAALHAPIAPAGYRFLLDQDGQPLKDPASAPTGGYLLERVL